MFSAMVGVFFKRLVSILLAAGGWLLAGIRTALDLIGWSTAPDDVGTAMSRLDQFFVWLLNLPWYAPWGFALVSTLWLMWVSWPRRQSATENLPDVAQAVPQSQASADEVLIANPDRIKANPRYIQLRHKLAPDASHLDPYNQVVEGQKELDRLYNDAIGGSREAFLMAGHLAEWLYKSARFYWGTSIGYYEVVKFIERRIENLNHKYLNKKGDFPHSSLPAIYDKETDAMTPNFELLHREIHGRLGSALPVLATYRITFPQRVTVERVIILFNTEGYNGAHDIKSLKLPITLQPGEHLNADILHSRAGIGVFWGGVVESTEGVDGVQYTKAQNEERNILRIDDMKYYCRLQIVTDKLEYSRDFQFSIIGNGIVNLCDPKVIEAYDPKRKIPARGMFL